jgi:hypothetical protein
MRRENAADSSGAERLPPSIWAAFRNTIRFVDAFGLDYGALDLVFDDDDLPYIVDVNPTPWGGRGMQAEIVAHLRAGLVAVSAIRGSNRSDASLA